MVCVREVDYKKQTDKKTKKEEKRRKKEEKKAEKKDSCCPRIAQGGEIFAHEQFSQTSSCGFEHYCVAQSERGREGEWKKRREDKQERLVETDRGERLGLSPR